MKKYSIILAAAALVFAACNKAEIDAPSQDVNPSVETELITVELNAVTKTQLGADGATTWSSGDAVSVSVGETSIGTLTLVEGSTSTFTGEITAGYDGSTSVTLNYPAGVTAVPASQTAVENSFANGAALLEGTTTVDELRAGEGTALQNKTALLRFSSPIGGNVSFTIGKATYTVNGCEATKSYYVCVDPANSGKLSYTAGLAIGAKSKDSFTLEANKIYNLGTLTLQESDFAVIGDYSNDGWNTDTKLFKTATDNFFVVYGVKFASDGAFKVRKAGVWDGSYNFGTTNDNKKGINSIVGVFTDEHSKNINIKSGTYDIYFDRLAGQVYLVEPGKAYTSIAKPTVTNKYCLAGSHNGWADDEIVYSGDGIWTASKNFQKDVQWKIKIGGSWNENWGHSNVTTGNNLTSGSGDNNVIMKSAGDYIVAFVKDWNEITIVKK